MVFSPAIRALYFRMHGILQILFPSLLEIEAPKVILFYKRVAPPDNSAA